MKDIHSHILFDIDDGSDSIKESINILKQAVDNGYTDIILTPHYRKIQGYTKNNQYKKNIFDKLIDEVNKDSLNIKLYLGNEVTIDEDLFYYIKTNQILTLNNSRYMLVELPFVGRYKYIDDILKQLVENNYIPIVGHPERYKDYTEKDYIKWHDMGILFQGNIESLFGGYGKKTRLKLEKLLKINLISFMGSDIHEELQTTYKKDIKEKLVSIINNKEIVLELVDKNIAKVIKNELIKPYKLNLNKKKFKLFNK